MSNNTTLSSIYTDKAPAVVGPYSQAIEAGEFIFCSGQIGIDPKTNQLVEGVENQTRLILTALKNVLLAAGSDLEHVVKTTIYLKDMKSYGLVNEMYGSYFTNHKPARATVEVSHLPKDALIEIELIARKNRIWYNIFSL